MNCKQVKIKFIILGICLLFSSIHIISSVLHPMNAVYTDSYFRDNWGYDVFKRNEFKSVLTYGNSIWLPLHPVITGASYAIYDNPITPRIIFGFLGILGIWVLFSSISKIFGDVSGSIAVLLYTFLPFRLAIDKEMLSESLSMVLMLSSVMNAMMKSPGLIVLSLISLSIGQLIRFEFWYIVPFMWLIIWAKSYLKLKWKIIYSIGTLLVPIYWILMNLLISGNGLQFFSLKLFIAQDSIPEIAYGNFANASQIWINRLINVVGIGGMVLFACSLGLLLKFRVRKKLIYLIILPIYFIFMLIIQVYLGTMEWQPERYLFCVVIFMIPVWAIVIDCFIAWHKQRHNKLIYLMVSGLVTLLVGLEYLHLEQQTNNYRTDISPVELQLFNNFANQISAVPSEKISPICTTADYRIETIIPYRLRYKKYPLEMREVNSCDSSCLTCILMNTATNSYEVTFNK